MHTNTNTLTHNAPLTSAESAPDSHALHEACDEAAIRSLEASLENPEPPTSALWSLEEVMQRQRREEQAPEYAPDAATVQADRDHEGICEMLLEDAAWEEFLPEGAAWSGAAVTPSPAKPAHDGAVLCFNGLSDNPEYRLPEPVEEPVERCNRICGTTDCKGECESPTVTPKVRDISPMFDTSDDELAEERSLAEVEATREARAEWQPEDAEFAPAPTASERAELLAKGLDPEFISIIGAACSA